MIKLLVGVQIFYYPQKSLLLREFFWQTEDLVPQLPRINKFLLYWQENIDAVINTINITPYSKDVKWRIAKHYGELSKQQPN